MKGPEAAPSLEVLTTQTNTLINELKAIQTQITDLGTEKDGIYERINEIIA